MPLMMTPGFDPEVVGLVPAGSRPIAAGFRADSVKSLASEVVEMIDSSEAGKEANRFPLYYMGL